MTVDDDRRRSDPPLRGVPIVARLASMVAFVGPIYYIVLVTLLGLLWTSYDPIRQTQSELGAVNAPHAPVMNVTGFMALGVIILAFAVTSVITLRGSVWTWLAAVALAAAGTGVIVVGFFPCDAGCVDVTQTGALHSTFSVPGAIGLPVAAMLSAVALRSDGRFGAAWTSGSFVIGALALGSGPVIGAELFPDFDGLLQRAAMWIPLLWMSAMALRLRGVASQAIRGQR